MFTTRRNTLARCIKSNIDIQPILREITGNTSLWQYDTKRQNTYYVHKDTFTIPIRTHIPITNNRYPGHIHESVDTPLAVYFPETYNFITNTARKLRAEISRAHIVSLKPHSKIRLHFDGGEYYRVRNRYHLVVYSKGRSILRIEDEEFILFEGSLWWFDNKRWHSAFNDSAEERIHVIFDLRPLSNL